MTVTIHVLVTPAKRGFKVTLWWWQEEREEWWDIVDETTDAAGEAVFRSYDLSPYPRKIKTSIEAGQVIDGVTYDGTESYAVEVENYKEYVTSLYPLPRGEEPEYVETYRDIEIWWYPTAPQYRAEIPGVATAFGDTLTEVKIRIDEVLDSLEPPEDPPSGWIAQVVAQVKAWVVDLMPGWVAQWGSIINNFITNTVENITNVYNDFRKYVTNVYNDTYNYLTEVYQDLRSYITNVYNDFRKYITQNVTNINQYITNVIGASVEWVEEMLADNRDWMRNFAKLMDPTGFLKDPLGTVSAAFAIWRLAADHVVVESFLEGFEEGLAEEVT